MSTVIDGIRARQALEYVLVEPVARELLITTIARTYQEVGLSLQPRVDRWGFLIPWRLLSEDEQRALCKAVGALLDEAHKRVPV